ncbi:MAG: MlaD family protein [Paludibacteraceae bacterium]
MKKTRNTATKVGIFVFSAIAILVLTIYFIGSKDNLFSTKTNITCSFQDIRGVVVGNNVRFSGMNIGTVKDIEMKSDTSVVLTLTIAQKYTEFIYKNSIVEIVQDGIMGSKLLNISSGTPDAGSIENGDQLRAKYGIDIENMLGKVNDILGITNEAVADLKSITNKIDNGDGDLGRLINANTLTTELATTTKSLNSSLANLDQITHKINAGNGDIGTLLNNNKLTTRADDVLSTLNQVTEKTNQVVTNLETTTKSINSGDGPVNLLLNSKQTAQNIDTTILKVQGSLEQFNSTAKAIEESWIIRLFSKKKKKDNHDANDSIK